MKASTRTPTRRPPGAAKKAKAPARRRLPPSKQKAKTPAAAAAAAAAAAPHQGEKKHTRNQLTDVLSIDIAPARVHSHIKNAVLPPAIEKQLTEKRELLKAAKAIAQQAGQPLEETEGEPLAAETAGVLQLKEEIKQLSQQVVRIGGDAHIATAALCDWIAKNLLRHALGQTLAAEHKIAEIGALHSGGLESHPVWPLVCDLGALADYDPAQEEELRKARTAANKAQKQARTAAKRLREEGGEEAANGVGPGGEDEAGGAPAPGEKGGAAPQAGGTTTFHTYVDNATKGVKQEEPFEGKVRVSYRLREVISETVAEFVERFSQYAKVNVLELLDVRTLNAKHIVAMVRGAYILKLGADGPAAAAGVVDYVNDKLTLYGVHLENERRRKERKTQPAQAGGDGGAEPAQPPPPATAQKKAKAAAKK
jgi:hypothetical protein